MTRDDDNGYEPFPPDDDFLPDHDVGSNDTIRAWVCVALVVAMFAAILAAIFGGL